MSRLKRQLKQLLSPEGFSDTPPLPQACGGPCQIVITGNRSVFFDGCESLLDYAENHISFRLRDRTITIYGKNLCIKTFRSDEVAVCGRIIGILEGEYHREVMGEDH